MRKLVFSACAVIAVVALSMSTAQSGTCYNQKKDNGDTDADHCQNQQCKYEENSDFSTAQWTTCGSSTGGGGKGNIHS